MIELNKKIQTKFLDLCKTNMLFRVELTGHQVWDLYLKSFTKENDPIFRDPNSSVHNCNHCNNFIRRYGNIVSINKNNEIETMFDVDIKGEFENTVRVLSEAIKNSKVTEVFYETFNDLNKLPYESCKKTNVVFQLGTHRNTKRYTKEEAEKFGVVKPNEEKTFNHFHLFLDKQFVSMSNSSIEHIMSIHRDNKTVFERGMKEISLDTLYLVKDLINQGSLLDGQTHLYKIEQIIPLKEKYDTLSEKQKNNWCWVTSSNFPLAKFKNELIGVLCSELSEGEELNKACQSWNKRVDPVNYMKTTAPITKKQIEEAKQFVQENGLEESFDRRFAILDDIKVSEILHSNVGNDKLKEISIFDNVKSTSTRHKRSEFDKIEEVTIEKFMKDILPGCTSIEAYLENRMEGNMVSLTTANNPESKPIFKWSNNYSWTFNGNLAGKSQIKENVKTAGGKVDGILRCSLQWNDEDTKAIIDFDLHCREQSGEISFRNKRVSSGGWLDVDMIHPPKVGIENITWQNKIPDGKYHFFVHNYSGLSSHKGCKVEIEFEGNVFTYRMPDRFIGNKNIAVITVQNGTFSIVHEQPAIEGEGVVKEIYNLETNQFHKVNLVCLSPNHWGDNNVGNKHYLFMLDNCKTNTSTRSFHNENLQPELAVHRKVLEVLGASNMIPPNDKQLSGLGFNATVKDELIVKIQGSHKRVIKIKF